MALFNHLGHQQDDDPIKVGLKKYSDASKMEKDMHAITNETGKETASLAFEHEDTGEDVYILQPYDDNIANESINY